MMNALRKLAFVSAACLAFTGTAAGFPALPVQAAEVTGVREGICGPHLTWELTSDGNLIITGTGEMYQYGDPDRLDSTAAPAPWGTDITCVECMPGVTGIGSYAFAGCKKLWGVMLPDTLTEIGSHAFLNCEELPVLSIPAGVSVLKGEIIENCRNLRTIDILNPDAEIQDNAFVFAASGRPVTFCSYENSTAEQYAQANNYPFVTIRDQTADAQHTCGDNVKWSLNESTGKLTISLIDSTQNWGTMYGYEEDYDPFGLYDGTPSSQFRSNLLARSAAPWGKDIKSVEIGAGVSNIGSYAFYGCKDLESVTLADSVSTIGMYAFSGSGLKSITLPESMWDLGACALADCEKLKSVSFPDTLRTIHEYAFVNCKALTAVSIPRNTEAVRDGAFRSCTGLSEITYPKSLREFGTDPFEGTAWLKQQRSTNSFVIVNGQLLCPGTAKGAITIPEGVQRIAQNAFRGNTEITSTELPDTLTDILPRAFENCTALRTVRFPNRLQSVGSYAFSGCTQLSAAELSGSLAEIDRGAFAGCSSLTVLTVPAGVKLIRPEICRECTALKTLTILNPKAVFPQNGELPFLNENNTAVIRGYADSTAQEFAAAHNWKFESIGEAPSASQITDKCGEDVRWELKDDGTLRIYGKGDMYDYVAPPYFTSLFGISQDALDAVGELFGLNEVSLSLLPWANDTDRIKAVVVEDGVTSVGMNTFSQCTSLKTVTIADSVTKICERAFHCCSRLSEVKLPKNLKSIGEAAFSRSGNNPGGLQAVEFPDGIESIGRSAFSSCPYLKDLTLPDSIMDVGADAFEGTEWLAEQNKQGDFTVANGVLLGFNCRFRDKIVIPDGVRVIAGDAMEYAAYNTYDPDKVLSIIIPEGVQSICEGAFCWCADATEIEIPDSVTRIGESAFFNCFSLSELRLPDNLRTIGRFAFGNCENLLEVTVPATVESVGEGAFERCCSLKSVTFLNPETEIGHSIETVSNDNTTEYGYYAGKIRGYAGSTAEQYAAEYSKTFEVINDSVKNVPEGAGDVDCNNSVDVADAVLLARYLNADAEAAVTAQGLLRADLNGNSRQDPDDLSLLLRFIAKKISF